MKKKIAAILICLSALFAVGCSDVSVNVLAYRQSGVRYRQINIVIPEEIYYYMNSKYSLEDYFSELCDEVDCGFELVTPVEESNGYRIVMLLKTMDDYENDDFTSTFESDVTKRGFFFTDVSVSGENPFDSVRRYENGEVEETYNDITAIVSAVSNGKNSLKSFQSIYGQTLAGFSPEELNLNFYYQGKKLMKDSNADDTETDSGSLSKFYLWSTTYGQLLNEEPLKKVEFSYRTASSVGWYVMALIIGAAITAILALVYYKKRNEPGKEGVYMTRKELYAHMYNQQLRARQQAVFDIDKNKQNVFDEFSEKENGDVFEEFGSRNDEHNDDKKQ